MSVRFLKFELVTVTELQLQLRNFKMFFAIKMSALVFVSMKHVSRAIFS